jgi:hypothetical protein
MTQSIPPTPKPMTTLPVSMTASAPFVYLNPERNIKRFPREAVARLRKIERFLPSLSDSFEKRTAPTAQPR